MNYRCGLFFLVFSSFTAFGQTKLNELTVDRPGIADAPFTVSPKVYQVETGFEYFKRTDGEIYFLPTTLFRTGLTNQAELRVAFKHIKDNKIDNASTAFSPLTVSAKVHIIHQRKWIPETDVMVDVIFPLGDGKLQPKELGHNIFLLFQNDISEKFAINYNLGMLWDGNTTEGTFTGSACFNYLPTERVGLFVEYFNYAAEERDDESGVDGGFTFLLLPLLQFDFSAGVSIINEKYNHFFSTGLSFRIEPQN